MVVALVKLLVLLGSAGERLDGHAILVDGRLHRHHNMVILSIVDTHGCGNHLDREVGRALERRAAAQVDDVLAPLHDALADFLPGLLGECLGAYQLRQRLSGHGGGRGEDRHLLAMSAISAGVLDLVGGDVEIFGQLGAQTC